MWNYHALFLFSIKGYPRAGLESARYFSKIMAVATEKDSNSSSSAPKKGGRGLSFEEKRKRLSEYFLEKVREFDILVVI